jgi:hypothetical protein
MQKLIEKTVTSGVAGAIFRPIFRFFGCMNDDHVEHISTGSYCVAVALELAACLFLFTGIDSLQGGLCCIKPNPTWAQTNETAVEHGPFGRACRTESHGVGFCKTGGFQCNGFNLDYSGASSTNADLSFAPGGFGQCRVKFPIYDTDRVGNCDPWTDKDSRKCWRQTYHIDSTQWSEYDTTEMCSQKGSERYIAVEGRHDDTGQDEIMGIPGAVSQQQNGGGQSPPFITARGLAPAEYSCNPHQYRLPRRHRGPHRPVR